MKLILLTICIAATVYADTYDPSYDNFDISEVLGNDRLLISYSKCLLDQGPCTAEVKKVKNVLPEALATRCEKCTDKQKQLGRQLVKEVKGKHPEIWKQLTAKYDPNGRYMKDFQNFLKE